MLSENEHMLGTLFFKFKFMSLKHIFPWYWTGFSKAHYGCGEIYQVFSVDLLSCFSFIIKEQHTLVQALQ